MSLSADGSLDQLEHLNENRAMEDVVPTMIVLGLATLAVPLRLYSKRMISARLKADDYLIIIAWVLAASCAVQIFPGVRYGLGKHVLRVGLADATMYGKLVMAYELNYCVTIVFIKFSILVFYGNIFVGRTFRRALYGVAIFVIAWYISTTFATIFQCTPISFTWDNTVVGGHCINTTAVLTALAILNMFTDFAILIMPMHAVWLLKVPRTQKFAVGGIFLLGGFVCIASVVRIVYLANVDTHDLTWTTVAPSLWSSVELCLGVVSACLPMMGPLMRAFLRLGVSIASASTKQASTKLSKLSNSGASGGYSGESRNGSVPLPGVGYGPRISRVSSPQPTSVGDFSHTTIPGQAGAHNFAWPEYSQTEKEYKATLDRDLDPVGFRAAPQRGRDRPRASTVVGSIPPPPPVLSTGVISEVTTGDRHSLDLGRGPSADSDDSVDDGDDEVRRLRGKHGIAKGSKPPIHGIRVERSMDWTVNEKH